MPLFMTKLYENKPLCYILICMMRTFLVLIAWSIALLIPEFQLAVSFVGGMYVCVHSFIVGNGDESIT